MYLQAFRESQKCPLDPDLTYIVEQLVSLLLATADVGALKAALQEKRLADVLVDELSFLGQIPRVPFATGTRVSHRAGANAATIGTAIDS